MSEWISVKKTIPDRNPSNMGCTCLVKRSNGEELQAFFHPDRMGWVEFYVRGGGSYWSRKSNGDTLYDVTHWRPPEGSEKIITEDLVSSKSVDNIPDATKKVE
jgi:hypothetical protein